MLAKALFSMNKQVVDRLEPLLRKYSSRLGYDDARSELIEWVLRAIQRYPLASPRPIPHPQRLSKPTVNSGRVSVEELPSHQELTTWEQ